jgi:hypothetical protein
MLDSERPSIKWVLSYLVLWVLHYAAKKLQKNIMQQNKKKITPLVLGSNFLLLELHFAAIDESTFSITLTVSNM